MFSDNLKDQEYAKEEPRMVSSDSLQAGRLGLKRGRFTKELMDEVCSRLEAEHSSQGIANYWFVHAYDTKGKCIKAFGTF